VTLTLTSSMTPAEVRDAIVRELRLRADWFEGASHTTNSIGASIAGHRYSDMACKFRDVANYLAAVEIIEPGKDVG
jgi:hypothetical protein